MMRFIYALLAVAVIVLCEWWVLQGWAWLLRGVGAWVGVR